MHHTDHIIPSEPRPLPADGALYFVGIGGAGMSAIAQVLAERGRVIYGADPGISTTVKARLEAVGTTVYTAHDAAHVGADISAVVVSDAIPQANPEVIAARERGIPIYRRPEVLGAIVNAGRGIAIAGTHGKTTTTGMVTSILMAAGLDPTVLIGGDLPLIGGNARNGKGEFVVAESCEAYDGFLYLHPEVAVILNIEADHLDYHGTEEHVIQSFQRFIQQIRDRGTVILNFDDTKCHDIWFDNKTWDRESKHLWGYGYTTRTLDHWQDGSTVVSGAENLKNISDFLFHADAIQFSGKGTSWDLYSCTYNESELLGHIVLNVPGLHNVSNALSAIAVALQLDIEIEHIIAGLQSFTGTGRRFEKLGEVNGITVIDDYAHHPTELRATLAAARSAFPDRRIVAVFQPHLPSRTRDLMDEFAGSLIAPSLSPLSPLDTPLSPNPFPPASGGERGVSEGGGLVGETDASPAFLTPLSPPLAGGKGQGDRGVSKGDRGKETFAVYLTDIYLAREQPIAGVSSETLAQRIAALPDAPVVTYVPNKADLPARLLANVRPGDVVITLGAGDIRAAGEGLMRLLSSGKSND